MVTKLARSSGWAMPENLKHRVIEKIGECMDHPKAQIIDQLAACRLAIEVDKQALQFVKTVMPQRVEHRLVKDYTDEELEQLVGEVQSLRQATKLLPPNTIIDGSS